LLTRDASRRIFEAALERVRRSFRLQVYGYVVMPEHVHLLLSEPQQDTLADALKSLKQGVARRLIGNLPLKPKAGLNGPPAFLDYGLPYSSCRRHQGPFSLRPLGARSSH
jgi:REP element-mobilizing transposase RayT